MNTNPQMVSMLYIIALFGILYFLMIRPQQQRQKKHQEMIKSVNVDDSVITVGGILGTVVKVKDNTVVLRVADNVRIELLKTSISQMTKKEQEEKGKE
ncbi:MAG: preprotein translocase subunit YajC [Eubacteriales bacterium]